MGILQHLAKYSLRDLWARLAKTALTVLGIMTGIAFMASLTSLTLSTKTKVSEDVSSLPGSAILASDVDLQPVPVFHISVIAQIPKIRPVIPAIIGG